ncbi:MAG: sigma-70 family RNA polymerase sigma factor [Pseudomonadota bacterium]|nr:sigma-70 family RNA polymerase sigma factor [Pseudomonadota bacterium]
MGTATGTGFDLAIETQLLEQLRAGARAAQASIYRQFERAVYTLARRMTNCPDAASDVMQNTFLRAFRSLHQYRGEAAFGHWLRSICATESLMHLRSGRRWMELFEPELLVDEDAPSVDELCQLDLERALRLLPPMPRAVLWLYHVEGYNHAEIAELCGKTASFSKSQLSRAHARLREKLDDGREHVAAPALRALP